MLNSISGAEPSTLAPQRNVTIWFPQAWHSLCRAAKKRQGNWIILINIKKARLRHWNEEVKLGKPDQLALPISF
jgi:hypothetical protein